MENNWVNTDIKILREPNTIRLDWVETPRFSVLKEFYEELKTRFAYLTIDEFIGYSEEELKQRISELELSILRIQQMMLEEIKGKKDFKIPNYDMTFRFGWIEPKITLA